jgi:hypothetical protein
MNEHKSVSESRIVITGLARDVSDVIDEEVSRLKQAFSDFEEIYFFIVESDSMDNTVEKLKELAIRDHCFDFLSLGAMQSKFPERIERLAHCRKIAAETIQKYEVDYVCVSDLDGTNRLLSKDAVTSCWTKSDWDVCTANQLGYYYDIYALRHKDWCARDYSLDITFLESVGFHPMKARRLAVLKKQKKIKRNAKWIEVESAFGGLAIYTKAAYCLGEYAHLDAQTGRIICEHVPFNISIKNQGRRIFINPALINHRVVRHSSIPSYFRYVAQYLLSMVSPRIFREWEKKRFGMSNVEIFRLFLLRIVKKFFL